MKSITQVVENLLKPYIDGKDQNIYKVMGKMGAKALLPMSLADIKARHSAGTWNGNAYTINGITYTINIDSDGFITDIVVTGTASADATLTVYGYSYTSDYAKVFDVPVIASTDFVGSDSTARGIIWGSNSGYIDGTELQIAAGTIYGFGLRVVNGYEIPEGGITFKPMLRFASDTDATYQPYVKTNKELTAENGALTNKLNNEIVTRSAMGAKNRLPITLALLKQTATAGTWANNVYTERGIDFTINTDASDYVTSIIVSGTASGVATINLLGTGAEYVANDFAGMILTGCPSDGGNDNYRTVVHIGDNQDGTGHTAQYEDGAGVTINTNSYVRIYIRIASGTDLTTPITFYPMIRLATDTDTTYQPYAKTNRELTDELTVFEKDTTTISGVIIEKVGHVVSISFRKTVDVTADAMLNVGTIPSKFRPDESYNFIVIEENSDPKYGLARISSNGNLEINGWTISGTSLALRGSVSYVVE